MSDATLAMAEEASVQPTLKDALTSRIALIFGIAFFSTATLYMVQPFFVVYFKQALGFSVPEAGLLVALPFLSAMLFGVVGGYLSDRIGVLRAFTLATAIFAVTIGTIGFTHSFVVAALLMLVSGLAMPVMSGGIQSLLNQSARPEHRGLLQNYLYWMNNVGVIIGLLVSAELLRAGDSNAPILLLGMVRLLLCVVILLAFREKQSRVMRGTADSKPSRPSMIATLRFASTDKALLYTAFAVLLLMIMESQVTATVPLYFAGHFHNGMALFGPIVAINAVVVVGCQPLAVKMFAKKRPISVFVVGALCTGGGLALGGMLGTVWAWIVGMVLYSIGEVLWSSKLNDLLGELPTPGNAALYFGTIGTAQNIAFFIGLTLGSIIYHALNSSALFGSMVIIAALAALIFRLATKEFRRRALRDLAQQDSVVQIQVPGVETDGEEPVGVSDTPSEEPRDAIQTAASFVAPRRVHNESVFGIPSPANRVIFLQGVTKEDWERVLTYTEIHRLSSGEMVIDAGELDRSMYVVEKGQLEVLIPSDGADSEYRRFTVIDAGSIFGEQTFTDGRPRSASVRAMTDVELRKLDWQAFGALSKSEPVLAQTIMADLAKILSDRLRQTTEYLNLLYGA